MIRTVAIRCKLPKEAADAFNSESGRIYTHVLVQHYRIYREKGVSPGSMEKLSDKTENRDREPLLHAHSIDAAQQGFPKACKTARGSRKADWMPRTRPSVSASGQLYGKTLPLDAGTPAHSHGGVVAHGLQA